MAPERTSLDVIAVNSSEEMVGIILEVAKKIPELELFAASPVEKTYFQTLVRTALPSAGFRPVGRGLVRDVGTLVQRVVQCGFLDAAWAIDEAFFSGSNWGDLETEQQGASLLAAFIAWQRRIYDGADDIAVSGGFPGMGTLFPYKDSAGVYDVAGTTAATASSVYYVKTGTQDCCLAWGKDGELSAGEIFPTLKYDAEGKQYHARAQNVGGWAGLQIVNHKSIVRLCNITADATHVLTDAFLNAGRLLFCERYGVLPDFCVMSYRSLAQLQNSRQSYDSMGRPAGVPETDSAKVPIIPTLGITNTEALLIATP